MQAQQVQVQSANSPAEKLDDDNIQAPPMDDDEEFGFDGDDFGVPTSSKVYVAKPTGSVSKYSKDELENLEGKTEAEIDAKAKEIFRGEVFAFSGCSDAQESADVADAEKSFGLKPVDEASKGGGAMTNSLLSCVQENPNISFGDLLVKMRSSLKSKGYTQNPQLSCSHQLNLKDTKFSLLAPKSNGNKKALLVGCNYTGNKEAELSGCVNDVKMVQRFLKSQGWPTDDPTKCQILTDEPGFGLAPPTSKNVLQGFDWLMKGAQPGDSLYLHLSGHGVSLPCFDKDDEPDGNDEAYAPLDFDDNGFIRDDVIFQSLVAPLPKGARLVVTCDTCHSGSMIDLTHVFVANEMNVKQYLDGAFTKMMANAAFSFTYAKNLSEKVWKGFYKGVGTAYDDVKLTLARWKKKGGGCCKGGVCCC